MNIFKDNDMPKKNICIGIVEISNLIHEFSDALKSNNYHVTTVAIKNRSYTKNVYDFEVNSLNLKYHIPFLNGFYIKLNLLKYFLKLLFKNDIFIYVWDMTFLPFFLDFLILKLFRKEIIIINCGSDVRYPPIQNKINYYYLSEKFSERTCFLQYIHNLFPSMGSDDFLRKFFLQRIEETFCKKIISTREQATFQKKPLILFRFPMKKLLNEPKQPQKKCLIIHAPSNPSIKGTDYVMNAIKLLNDKNIDFEFECIVNKSNDYVLSRLLEADIVIDQSGFWIARFACEGLAAGCVVFGGNQPSFLGYGDDSPVIQFYPDSVDLSVKLEEIILNVNLRQKLMIQSFRYWEKYYSYEAFNKYFSDILAGNAETFFAPDGYKNQLIKFSGNFFQKIIIKCFY